MSKTPDEVYLILKEYCRTKLRVSQEDSEFFCCKFKFKRTKRNELLLSAGDVCPHMYFINKGCLRVYMMDRDGREATRFVMMESRFGTAFPSFILQEPSLAYIQSVEPSELLYINFSEFNNLLNTFPGWERVYRINLEKDYIASIKRIESLITMDAKERYEMLLATEPQLIQRLPSKIVADYLGISQETLSRLKSKK
ncbi:MAG: Crp/Fnr family transcriptional regulator [Bacteroidetes bacterium]|nr:Crp/Fnr family transcriptional regulator [Bacteroidota bacterium]